MNGSWIENHQRNGRVHHLFLLHNMDIGKTHAKNNTGMYQDRNPFMSITFTDGIHNAVVKSLFKIRTREKFSTELLIGFLEFIQSDVVYELHVQLTQVYKVTSRQFCFGIGNI